MLQVQNLTLWLRQDSRLIFQNFSMALRARDRRVALIGAEGNGKSTLLKLLAVPDQLSAYAEWTGEVHRDGLRMGYLPQLIGEDWGDLTPMELILRDQVELDWNRLYAEAAQLGLSPDLLASDRPALTLSGGERLRFQLLFIVMVAADLFLFDEPTNDLDAEGLAILDRFFEQRPEPIVFVSHDEAFLARWADTVIHLEQLGTRNEPRASCVRLGYDEYRNKRQAEIIRQGQIARKERAEHAERMDRYRRIYDSVQDDLRKEHKDMQNAKNLKDKMHSVKAMGRRFERMAQHFTELPRSELEVSFFFDESVQVPQNRVLLDLDLPELKVGDGILARTLKLFWRGPEKICITGRNGAGKSTLLRRIAEELKSDPLGVTYIPQDLVQGWDLSRSAVQLLSRRHDREEQTRIRTYLGSLRMAAEEMDAPLSALSGGQRSKVFFAAMAFHRDAILILDEPSRNLSPLALPVLREALQQFGGAILAVSHDRRLIDSVFDRVYCLDEKGLHEEV